MYNGKAELNVFDGWVLKVQTWSSFESAAAVDGLVDDLVLNLRVGSCSWFGFLETRFAPPASSAHLPNAFSVHLPSVYRPPTVHLQRPPTDRLQFPPTESFKPTPLSYTLNTTISTPLNIHSPLRFVSAPLFLFFSLNFFLCLLSSSLDPSDNVEGL
jgi:hypothetical protein